MSARRVSQHDWPRLTRFYGIPPSELKDMPNVLLNVYAEQLIRLQSEETLTAFLISDMPHMEKNDRKNARRPYLRFLPDAPAPKVDLSSDEGRNKAASLGIKVDLPPTEVES